MWARVTVKTPPAALPLVVADLAARLRVDDADEHPLLEAFLRAAVAEIDGPQGIGVAVMRQTWTLTLDRFYPLIDLPGAPIAEIAAIRYLDDDGGEQTLDPSAWRLVTGFDPVIVTPAHGTSWPRVIARPGAVRIDYLLGAETPAEADPGLVTAAALIAGHYYEHRAAVSTDAAPVEIPLGAQHILARHRRGLAGA